jgi:hypothetical protein
MPRPRLRTGLSASDDGQPFVRGEVSKVLGVECRKQKIIDQAAGGYPGVVVRPGPLAPLRAGLQLAPFVRHRLRLVVLVSSGVTVASASAMLARECAARCGHFIAAYATAC